MRRFMMLVAITAVLGWGGIAGAWTLVEGFTDSAWQGTPIWGGWAYTMVNGTNGWTVASPQVDGQGLAYVRDVQTDWSASIYAEKGSGYQSSITHAVPSLTTGQVIFTWADGYGQSSIKVRFLGPGDVLAAEVQLGRKFGTSLWGMFMKANGTDLVLPDQGMTVSYANPGQITIGFDCALGTIIANANNGGVNFAEGRVASFNNASATIEKIRLLADQDGGTSSEIDLTAAGITITDIAMSAPRLLRGTVTLGDYSGEVWGVGLTVDFRQGGVSVNTQRLTLNAAGQFVAAAVPVGTYDVTLKACSWLRKVVTGVEISNLGTTDLGPVTLLGGDCNGNDAVDSTDLAIVLANMDAEGD